MLHYRRMRRGDVGDVVRLLVPDESDERLRELVRAGLRRSLHSHSATLVVICYDLQPQSKMHVLGVAVMHLVLVLAPERDGMVGMLSIHAADGDEDFYVDAVFEGLSQEMLVRARTLRWACRLEELGEGLTFV